MSSRRRWGEYEEEIARRFAAAYISVHTGSTFNTIYRKLKDKKPGSLWIELARMAIERGVPDGGEIDLDKLDLKGPVQ